MGGGIFFFFFLTGHMQDFGKAIDLVSISTG